MFDDLPLFSVYELIVVELYLLVMLRLRSTDRSVKTHNSLVCGTSVCYKLLLELLPIPCVAQRGLTDRSKRGGCLDYWRRGPSLDETPFTTCTPDLHLKTHGPVVEPIAGVSESIKSFEPVNLPNPPVASTSSSACATKQLTIAAAVKRAIKYKAGRSRKRRIGACIIKLVTTDVQPLTVVENRSSKQRL